MIITNRIQVIIQYKGGLQGHIHYVFRVEGGGLQNYKTHPKFGLIHLVTFYELGKNLKRNSNPLRSPSVTRPCWATKLSSQYIYCLCLPECLKKQCFLALISSYFLEFFFRDFQFGYRTNLSIWACLCVSVERQRCLQSHECSLSSNYSVQAKIIWGARCSSSKKYKA